MDKTCKQCQETKNVELFNVDNSRPDGRTSKCRACRKAYYDAYYLVNRKRIVENSRRWNEEHKEEVRRNERNRKRNTEVGKEERRQYERIKAWRSYGLTEEQIAYVQTVKSCEVCGSTKRLSVDHCHEKMVYRGVLCGPCNSAIGFAGDSPQRMKQLLDYLTSRNQEGAPGHQESREDS